MKFGMSNYSRDFCGTCSVWKCKCLFWGIRWPLAWMRCRTRKPSVTERNHLEQAHYTCTCISPYMIICCNHEQGHAPQKKHMIRISFTLTKQVFTLAMDHPANRSVPDVCPVALQAPCATGCASPFQPSHKQNPKHLRRGKKCLNHFFWWITSRL